MGEAVEFVQYVLQGLAHIADRVVVDVLELVVEALKPAGRSFSEALGKGSALDVVDVQEPGSGLANSGGFAPDLGAEPSAFQDVGGCAGGGSCEVAVAGSAGPVHQHDAATITGGYVGQRVGS